MVNSYYWSSSQNANYNIVAWYVYLSDGGVDANYTKYGNGRVCCIRKFVEQEYHAGDVLLNDGTILPYDTNFTAEQKNNAVGVLFMGADQKPAGWLGLYNSAGGTNSGSYQWASERTIGYNKRFTDIICTPSNTDNEPASTATFTGDTDGSDNWAYLCQQDPTGTADAATNYPAFNYVNNYATTANLTGDYATGWYMPSLAELCYIYRNKSDLNSVLNTLGGVEMVNFRYWSSSQNEFNYYYAWNVYLPDGTMFIYDYKNYLRRVCCVRAF
jgi:hypothetical protein